MRHKSWMRTDVIVVTFNMLVFASGHRSDRIATLVTPCRGHARSHNGDK
jgi:hypothetical protein